MRVKLLCQGGGLFDLTRGLQLPCHQVNLEIWGHQMANKCISFQCDNEALVYVLNKQLSNEPKLMFLLRKLILMSLKHNILFKAEHILGKKNNLNDALSRLQIQKFRHLHPEAEKHPMSVPALPQLPT